MDIPNDSDEEKDAKFKEFGPITPDDKDHSGFGGFLSSFFRWRKSKYEGENSNKHHENESFNNAPYPIWLPPSENTATAPVDSGSLTNINSESNESGKKKYQLGSESVTISYERHLHYVLKRIKTIAEKKDSDMKDHWVPDSHRKECYDCSEKFTQLRRKHHCRICGQIFCSKCCNKVISTKPMGFKGELKVCTYCFKVFSCCIKTNNFEEDVMADIILLEEELLPVVNASNLPSGELTGEHERRLILEKRKRRGFMEENYTVKSRSFSSDFTSRVDQNDLDKIASERQLLLKDSQQLQSLWMCMVSGPNKLHLSTNRHRLKAFSETFIGRDFVQWMVDNDKASCRQSAIAIGQALLEAGFIFCVSQQEQQFSDEHVLYTALKPHDFKEKTTAPQSLSVTHDMGQEPLWLKQISSQVESDNILPSKAAFTNAPIDSLQNVSASSSNYSLDLNVKENVVSLKHPGRRKGVADNETETDMARGLETSVSAVLNDTIYSFSSEQQSSGTVMTEEVLEALKSLEPKLAETRAAGWQIKNEDENLGREVEVDEQTRTSLIAKKKLSENWRHFENRLLLLLLSNMEIDISWSTTILSLVYKVVDTVCPDVKNESDDMDIRQYIQIKKVSGGKRNECRIINGTVCSKNISDREMRSRLSDPQILIIASHVDFHRRSEPFKEHSMRNELNQEEEYIKNAVSKILSYKPDILITKGKVSYLAKNYLKNADVTVVMNVKTSVIDRIARCTQAQVIPCVDALAANPGAKELPIKPLGMCHSFYIRSFGSYNTKHLMFFDGCATHLGCTVILRGAPNRELKGVKRVMSFMIFALYNWKLEKAYMMDIFASVTSLKTATALSFECKSPVKEKIECKENTEEATRDTGVIDKSESPLSGGKSEKLSFPLHSTPNKITEANLVSDKSDPLQSYLSSSPLDKPEESKNELLIAQNDVIPFSYALERNILTISPYIEFVLPYLESDKGKKSPLRRFFNNQMYFSDSLIPNKPKKTEYNDSPSKKEDNPNVIFKPSHYFVTATLTKPASDVSVQAALADFRARGGTIQNVCRCSSKTNDDEVKLSVREEIKKLEVEIEEKKRRENLKKFYFTEEGKIDALHPFNHQRISVLFSSFSQSFHFNSTFCVTPSVLTMDFYGRNDINLGAFLERYCFNSTYKCLSAICTAPFLHHVRKFVHGSGCIEILLRQMESSLDEMDSTTIYMWSWCKLCRQVSPVVPMSSDTWTFSFAKYLEFRFQESKINRRGAPGCCHSIHRDHFHYFGQKDLVAVFKYISIPTRELVIPPSEIEYVPNPVQPSVIVDMIKSIAIQGYGVFSSIVDRLSTISEEIGQRWDPLLESVATHHQKQKQIFRESIEKIQLQLTSPTLEKRRCNQEALKFDKDLANILNEISDQIVLLKGQIVQVVQDWNSKVQDLLNLRKKDDKDKQRTNSGNISRPSGSLLSSTSSTLTGSVEQLQLSSKDEIFNHQEISDSSDHTIEEEKSDVFPEEQRNECSTTEGNKTSGIENKKVVGTQREEKITDHRTLHSFAQTLQEEKSNIISILEAFNNVPSSPTSSGQSGRSPAGVSSPTSAKSVSSFINDSTEKDVSGGIHAVLGSKEVSQGSELISRHRQISSTSGNVRSGLEQFIPSPSRVGHHERSFSDESEAVIAKDILERIPEKRYSSSVKNIISTLWSSSADLMIKSPFDPMEHYNILPEVKIPVVINDDEPSSIIAKALASQEYETKLQILQVKLNELQQGLESSHKTTESLNSSPTSVSNASQEGVATKGSDSDKQSSQKDMHIDLQWNDSHANYYCKILFVDQFRELRQLIFPSGEELFIRSLSRCVSWDARGGKSGSAFCKTVDDRFVLKEMSRFEINSFLEFAPAYIQYITNCYKKNIPTALTRIVGVYRIGYKNTLTNRAEKFDFLVMENLFYQRSVSTKFDLKGSERNRKVKLTGKEESEVVLLDENLLQMACSSPFYLRPHGKDVLTRAIVEDSNFLSQQFIMDYSLLVGVDEENNELVVGIIDYIRTFTWDKKLETIIKGSRLAGGAGKSPTILSPDSYRNRFCLAMESYFVLAPDRWTSLEEGVSLSE